MNLKQGSPQMITRKIGRRDFLKMTGTTLAGAALFGNARRSFAETASDSKMWKQFSGTTLNFISENTPPSSAIAANTSPFTDLTGIKLNIAQMELGSVVQKVALDFGSGQSAYQVIYADPYQVLAPFYKGFVDLKTFLTDENLPKVPGGIEDFIPTQLDADGKFENPDILYTLPYDCPTMIWIYRKDLFDKYGSKMQQDLGFDTTPSEKLTWDQYYQIADWFNKNAKADVAYGTGHQAKQYDSLMCDFSNILWAYGGEYFKNETAVGRIGTTKPGPSLLDQELAVKAAEFYKKLLSIAHPGSLSWDWSGLAEAFKGGQIAMMPEWHEFAADLERSLPGGKVGYSVLPRGPVRSANMYGGTGIGINKNASKKEQQAAWLFLVWSTSPEVQVMDLKSAVGGGTPTRKSVYEIPEVKKAEEGPSDMPNMLSAKIAVDAWKPENIGLRPKIATWNECDTAIFTAVSKMLAGNQGPKETMSSLKKEIDRINGVG
jgi:multiple sugar transport system substrate-binding protein